MFGRLHGDRADPETPPYDVDLEVFNQLAAESLETADEGTPVVVDELGILELDAAVFIAALSGLFQRAGPGLVVIQERALASWKQIIGSGNIDRVFTLERAIRDELPAQVAAAFRQR